MEDMFTRTAELIGNDNIDKIKKLNICVVGVGGVGGSVVEMLVRTGVQNLTIIDSDVIKASNINRQIIALNSTLNLPKVVAFEKRIKDINPNCKILCVQDFLNEYNVQKYISTNFDYVIDCIDTVSSKVSLVKFCKQNNINIISALGAGNRLCVAEFEIKDIYNTSFDPLAKVLRKKLRDENIENLDVCVSKNPVDIVKSPPTSIVWQPVVCGATICAFVLNKFIE